MTCKTKSCKRKEHPESVFCVQCQESYDHGYRAARRHNKQVDKELKNAATIIRLNPLLEEALESIVESLARMSGIQWNKENITSPMKCGHCGAYTFKDPCTFCGAVVKE